MGRRHAYKAFNKALAALYKDSLTLAARDEEPFEFDDEAFQQAAEAIYNEGGFNVGSLRDDKVRRVIDSTARALSGAIDSGLPHEVPQTMRHALDNNAFVFSGFKTYHSLREVGLSLVREDGATKPFSEFLEDVRAINEQYNHNYLYAEYNHAVGSALMAAKWRDIESDGDRYNLQYRTAGDERVRTDHAALHGVTLPPSDPFWSLYYPPNGWNCRCTAIQVRKTKYDESDSEEAIRLGDLCTDSPKQRMFRHNVGQTLELFPPKHPYYKAPQTDKKAIERTAEYLCLLRDPDYTEVELNEYNYGLRASHVLHNFDAVGGEYERQVQDIGFKAGHAVVLESERGKDKWERSTEGTWDGMKFEVAGRETATVNNILRGLKHCAAKRDTEVAVLHFPHGNFNSRLLADAINRYRGLEKQKDGQFLKFKKIVCTQNGQIVYEEDF